jgi:hypothetical protein
LPSHSREPTLTAGEQRRVRFVFGGTGMSDVIVEDITQNEDADVTIGMSIVNG